METATRESLAVIAGQLAAIVGVVHLGLGTYYSLWPGGPAVAGDLRVLVWGVAGAVLVGGVAVATLGVDHRGLYWLGAGLVAALLAGHFLWPVLFGGQFYLGAAPAAPPGQLPGYLVGQVTAVRPVAQVALAAELVLAGLLAVLLVAEEQP